MNEDLTFYCDFEWYCQIPNTNKDACKSCKLMNLNKWKKTKILMK